jgi:hypothetical protein
MLYWQGNAHMRDSAAQAEYRTNKLRDWLLALLRYAVTLHDADKSAVLAIAEEIDKLGSRAEGRSTFKFFRRTSIELCRAILDKHNSKASAVLRLHLNRIDDYRLKRAVEAAIEFGDASQIIKSAGKIRKRGSQDLWKGLRPPRDD